MLPIVDGRVWLDEAAWKLDGALGLDLLANSAAAILREHGCVRMVTGWEERGDDEPGRYVVLQSLAWSTEVVRER